MLKLSDISVSEKEYKDGSITFRAQVKVTTMAHISPASACDSDHLEFLRKNLPMAAWKVLYEDLEAPITELAYLVQEVMATKNRGGEVEYLTREKAHAALSEKMDEIQRLLTP